MKFIKGLLMFFGILFVIQIILLIFIYFWNPLGLWGHSELEKTTTSDEVYDHPMLTNEQEETLDKLGIDVEYIPERITPVMQECFTEKLGQERVDEIIGGEKPSAIDIFKARDCIN
jgi:hypothetical protein